MFSRNNCLAWERKMTASKQHFGLRKIMGGVASVLLGLTFLYGTQAAAAEVNPTDTAASNQTVTVPRTGTALPAANEGLGVRDAAVIDSPVMIPTTDEAASQAPAEAANLSQVPFPETENIPVVTPPEPVAGPTTPATGLQSPATEAPTPVTPPVETVQPAPTPGMVTPPNPAVTEKDWPSYEHRVEISFIDDQQRPVLMVNAIAVFMGPGHGWIIDLRPYREELEKHGLTLAENYMVVDHLSKIYHVPTKHLIKEKEETKTFSQYIYGVINGQYQLLDTQTITVNRHGMYDYYLDKYVGEMSDWYLNGQAVKDYQFQDYTVDYPGYFAETRVVTGTRVNLDGDKTTFNQYVNLAAGEVQTEKKTVQREVTVHYPDGKVAVIRQTVAFTRTRTYNPFTKELVADSGWSYQLDGSGDWIQNSKAELPAIDLPEIDGKRPVKTAGDLGAIEVTPDSQNLKGEVWYEAARELQHYEEKVVNRVIHHHYPDGRVESVKHEASFKRPVYLNLQTQELEYGAWEGPAAFEDYTVPQIPGYTADKDIIAGAAVQPDHLDHVHHVYYTIDDQPGTDQPDDNQPGTDQPDSDQPGGTGTNSNRPGSLGTVGDSTAGDTGNSNVSNSTGSGQQVTTMTLAIYEGHGSAASANIAQEQTASVAGAAAQDKQATLPATGSQKDRVTMLSGAVLLGLMVQLLTLGLLRRKKVDK